MQTSHTAQELTRQMLHELGFSPRLSGYKALCLAIPNYAQNSSQSITKELYPYLRREFGYIRPAAVERTIRYAISEAWERGDPGAWGRYFPRCSKAPSNMVLIATLAEYIR